MNYATPRLSLPGIQPPPRDPKQSEDRLESSPQNLSCNSRGCSKLAKEPCVFPFSYWPIPINSDLFRISSFGFRISRTAGLRPSVSICGCLEFLRLRPRFLALSALIFAFLFLPLAQAADFYVATNGNDTTGNGSLGNPYATISKAVQASRTSGKEVQKNIFLRGGRYYNVNVLVTQYQDANIAFLPYPGEQPVLYGGQPLTNWTATGDGLTYSAPLPAFPGIISSGVSQLTNWQPRMLLADDVVCSRGRLPTSGKFHYTSFTNQSGSGVMVYTNNFPNSTNMELICDRSWNDAEMAVTNIDTVNKVLKTIGYLDKAGANMGTTTSFAVVNTPEGITGDNQFWWNKTNACIVFRPPAGKDPNMMSIIVPSTTRMFYLVGFSITSEIENITFSNLTFAATTVPIGSGLKDDSGATYRGAVVANYTTNCVVDHCTFYGIAGTAITTENWHDNSNFIVRNCVIHDVGVGGVYLDGGSDCTVSNNLIYNTGLICQGGTGVRGSKHGALISFNTITNTMGAGIVVSGGGASIPATQPVITYNYLSRCMRALRDMGGIYMWFTYDALVANNYIGEINGTNSDNGTPWDSTLIGIYCDQGTTRPTIASNIVYNCTRPILYHMATNGTYLNNFFINTRPEDTILSFANCDLGAVFQKNILFSQNRARVNAANATYIDYSVNANVAVLDWQSNIFWSVAGLNSGNPTDATTRDPLFLNLVPLNAAFQQNSPAAALQTSPLTLNSIGSDSQRPLLPATYLQALPQ